MFISGMSGNEIYCLALKGLAPGEITVGNSVQSLGVGGALSAFGRSITGGEIRQITTLISEGRHAAIARMEEEGRSHGAHGISGVTSGLSTLAGFTEFLAQGTAVHEVEGQDKHAHAPDFFSTAAPGMELYCHLDTGYRPHKFVMGNVVYALGVGRGLTGSLRTLGRGEVREFSSMYNELRHTALRRLRAEASTARANSVVDVRIDMLPHATGTMELLLTGTASFHPAISSGPLPQQHVITSELAGEELWNLAKLGYAPLQLMLTTSVYSLGVAASIGSLFQAVQRGELPEVTKLIYEARENCLDLIRREAEAIGAAQVIGNKLRIREIAPGLVELVAMGTAVQKAPPGTAPETERLPPQAVITDASARKKDNVQGLMSAVSPMARAQATTRFGGKTLVGALLAGIIALSCFLFELFLAIQRR